MAVEPDNLALARQFASAVERGASDEVAALLAEDVLQEEFPNLLMPQGATRDKAAILAAGERGKKAMAAQRYEVVTAVASGDHVALELRWTGTLAAPLALQRNPIGDLLSQVTVDPEVTPISTNGNSQV